MKKQPRKRIGLTVEHIRVLTQQLEHVRGGFVGPNNYCHDPDNTNQSKQHVCVTVQQ
ncbi:MAG TPA: hypothetical protein VMJ10_30420 [Kofleriaceae bacterium]|nr:hypothetical protein [Kofleriaceae bacterium]